MSRIVSAIDAVSDNIGKVSSYGVPAIMAIMCYEVVMRYVFNNPTLWVHEMSGFLFVVCLIFGGSYALLHGEHVRVDMLFNRLKPRAKAIFEIIFTILMMLMIGTLLWVGTEGAMDSVSILELSQNQWHPPLYPVKVLIAVGIFLFMVQLLANLVKHIRTAARGGK